MAADLDAWFEEAVDDTAGIARAVADLARALGMTEVTRNTGMSRENLYVALSNNGNPSFATFLQRLARRGCACTQSPRSVDVRISAQSGSIQ